MSQIREQLALRFPLRRRCTFVEFESGANAELVARLAAPVTAFLCVWIAGDAGSGKSHLLQASCASVNARGGAAAYVPRELVAEGAQVFDGLEAMDRVAIDDIGDWLGQPAVERGLLALYQGLLDRGRSLVVAHTDVPAAVAFALPDLASRMRAAAIFRIAPLDDEGRLRVMTRTASARGMMLEPGVAEYILRHGPRSLEALLGLVDRLDARTLARQRRLTVPLVRELLDEIRDPPSP